MHATNEKWLASARSARQSVGRGRLARLQSAVPGRPPVLHACLWSTRPAQTSADSHVAWQAHTPCCEVPGSWYCGPVPQHPRAARAHLLALPLSVQAGKLLLQPEDEVLQGLNNEEVGIGAVSKCDSSPGLGSKQPAVDPRDACAWRPPHTG